MRVQVLHLDSAFDRQQEFMDTCRELGVSSFDMRESGTRIRLWGRDKDLNDIKALLPHSREPTLTFMGSGDFHHVTALLMERLAEMHNDLITLIHFDNHPDWVHFRSGMHCGSWVNRALRIPNVTRVITLGVCSDDLCWPEFKGGNLEPMKHGHVDLFPYNHAPSRVWKNYGDQAHAGYTQRGHSLFWRNMAQQDEVAFLDLLCSRILTNAIYITVDKDVLDIEDVVTNWDQGEMRMPQLLRILQLLGEKYRIIGADVIGDYSAPDYAGNGWTVLKKRSEIWFDQPRRQMDPEQVAATNAASNLALLHAFQEAMA